MTTRYSTIVDRLRSPEETIARYHRVLVAVAQAQEDARVFSNPVAQALEHAGPPTVEAWLTWERRYRHDTAGFVQAQRDRLTGSRTRSLIYLGMTSSNLIDCADALAWQRVQSRLSELVQEICDLSPWDPRRRMGRTHGRAAEPVPINRVYDRMIRDLQRSFEMLVQTPLMGALAGPVGQFNMVLNPEIARAVADALQIPMDMLPTQTSSRFRMGQAAMGLVQLIGACEQIATHHRLQSISEIDEFREVFVEGTQKGSSVMPHKRNPMVSERICGLARVARGYLAPVLETANTQWWERDLTNSSVEREAFWPLVNLAVYILEQTLDVLGAGQTNAPRALDPEIIPQTLTPSEELIQRVLDGEDHEHVYRDIQERTR